ncbi:coil containing protein [Vibrio phage 1.042.O._10N.286.45.B8]|nr:coil containing protein [Vibrio phage 1.042.O._10N.286.45.B8]
MSVVVSRAVWEMQLPLEIPKNKRSTIKLILAKLADNSDSNGKCWPSMARIAHECEVSERTVVRAVKALSELNIISVTTKRDGFKKRNTYYINIMLIRSLKSEYESSVEEGDCNPYHYPCDTQSNPCDIQSKLMDSVSHKPSLTIKEPSQDNLTRGEEYLSEDELPENLHLCREGMDVMRKLDSVYSNIYLGKQKLSQWKECESALNEISYDIEESMFRVYEEKKLYRRDKLIGMPFILMINSDTDMCELIK